MFEAVQRTSLGQAETELYFVSRYSADPSNLKCSSGVCAADQSELNVLLGLLREEFTVIYWCNQHL